MIKALETAHSNIHVMLRFCLGQTQAYRGSKWQPSMEYFIIQLHQSKQGFMVWNRVARTLKEMLPEIRHTQPMYYEEILKSHFWRC